MKVKHGLLVCFLSLSSGAALSQEMLPGDTRLACEALLCLSSETRPPECTPALSRYFGINYRKWSDTARARQNFLNMCPTVAQSPDAAALAAGLVQTIDR